MNNIDLMSFVNEQYLWLIPVLMCLGAVLKSIPKILDWSIPILLYIVGIILGFIFIGGSTGTLQGLLCATASIGLHQGYRQIQKK